MNHRLTTRRTFIEGCFGISGGLLISTIPANTRMTFSASQIVRRDIATLDPNGPEISSFRKGVAEMRRRSQVNPSDPTGWIAQANIHRDFCSHQNWWFLPWHRAYLYAFEQILRDAAQDPTLTLPYWNWSKDKRLPGVVWGNGNSLNDPTREVGTDDEASDEFIGASVIQAIVTTPDYISFGSAQATDYRQRIAWSGIEATPHNYIHSFIGGDNGNMMDPVRAALDPIFWFHHSNVDRLWTEWVKNNPGRLPTDPVWRNHSYDFYDIRGKKITFATHQVLSTFDMNYRYDTQASPSPVSGLLAKSKARIETLLENAAITDKAQTFTLMSNPAFQIEANKVLQQPQNSSGSTLRIALGGISAPKTSQAAVRIFLNLPTANADTPLSNPHYLTSFAFFEHTGDQHPVGHNEGAMPAFYVDATRVLKRLQTSNLYKSDQPLMVTLIVVSINPKKKIENVKIPFSKLSLTVVP